MLTPCQRSQAMNLLADGKPVWQVADHIGADRREVGRLKEHWAGVLLGMRRERQGQRVDGSPAQVEVLDRPILRARTLYCGPGRRISLRPGGPNDVTIRVALDMVWTDEAVDALCKALSRMSSQALDALVMRIREG